MATSPAKKANKSKAKPTATPYFGQNKSRLRKRTKKRQSNPHNSLKIPTPIVLLSRLIIITVGISTIVGSAIAISHSFQTNSLSNPRTSPTTSIVTNSKSTNLENLFSLVAVGREITPLSQKIQALTTQYPQLETGIAIADIADKSYVNIKATKTFASASTIKLPISVALFQDVDAGKIDLSETLTMTKENIAEGSGEMQYQPVDTKFSVLKTATNMMTVSDNTATNMLIERLGGAKVLNQRFADWGLTATQISDRLPDLEGSNTTSPEDLSNLLFKIEGGQLVSLTSRDRILAIMKQTEINNLLPQGLGTGATIAHKTGNIKSVLGDTGIVDLPNGKRYLISVLVKRPDNDPQAQSLIQEISQTAYQYFQQTLINPSSG